MLTRHGRCISLDFIELPVARSGPPAKTFCRCQTASTFSPVGPGCPTFKTATAELQTAARNFVSSLFRDVGLQDSDVLVSDRDIRFTSAFWICLHEALGA